MASDDLRARLAAAFRAAAFDCPGDCGRTESECVAQHPIQVEVLHFDEIAVIGGPVEALADVAVTIIRDIAVPLRDELARLQARLARAHVALQAVREAQSLGEALAAVAKHDGITTEPTMPGGLRGLLEHVGVGGRSRNHRGRRADRRRRGQTEVRALVRELRRHRPRHLPVQPDPHEGVITVTRRDRIYGATLNLLGSDIEPDDIQACLDRERVAAVNSHWVRRLFRWARSFGGAR